jgi:hypothetical protein
MLLAGTRMLRGHREVPMPNWIVWSKPAPIKVLARAAVLAVVVALPLVFLLQWLGFGYRFSRIAATLIGTWIGLWYVQSRKPNPTTPANT